MIIRELRHEEEPVFNKLARSYGTIFNTIEWTGIFDTSITRYGIFSDGGEMIGGFIIYRERMFGLSVYRDPPYTPMIGPFLRVDASNPVAIMSRWKDAVDAMANLIERLPYSIVSLSLNTVLVDTQPFIWKKFKVTPVYTYILDLTMPLDELLKRMSNERRKNIQKATKDGLSVKEVTNYEDIASLVLKTFARQNQQINTEYMRKILFTFANRNNSYAFVTLKENLPVACSFVIHDDTTAYYLLGGYDNELKHHGAGALSMWEAIKQAKQLGLQRFDFEGSMLPHIERYFRGFGGTLKPYFRINKARILYEIVLKFIRRELF
ncbi:MAG: GNAT family N-acetyltransferase [Thermodesulfovibrionales bacterium]|nr:GNAT family N-acetyltransferase [Thermodesulfovibrionales bacterium]